MGKKIELIVSVPVFCVISCCIYTIHAKSDRDSQHTVPHRRGNAAAHRFHKPLTEIKPDSSAARCPGSAGAVESVEHLLRIYLLIRYGIRYGYLDCFTGSAVEVQPLAAVLDAVRYQVLYDPCEHFSVRTGMDRPATVLEMGRDAPGL